MRQQSLEATAKLRITSELSRDTAHGMGMGVSVDIGLIIGKILETYVGVYEVTPDFTFSIIKEQDKLFLQAPEQEKLEMFADTENKFFLKVNDALLEFVKDDSGKITKAIMNQDGRQADAIKIK